jgi:hypothetical protein
MIAAAGHRVLAVILCPYLIAAQIFESLSTFGNLSNSQAKTGSPVARAGLRSDDCPALSLFRLMTDRRGAARRAFAAGIPGGQARLLRPDGRRIGRHAARCEIRDPLQRNTCATDLLTRALTWHLPLPSNPVR